MVIKRFATGGVILTVVAVTSIVFLVALDGDEKQAPEISTSTTVSTSDSVEPAPSKLCLDFIPSTAWPIRQAMDVWNSNGVNLFSERSLTSRSECIEEILIIEAPLDLDVELGRTQFLHKGHAAVVLNTATPEAQRLQVACHELGHVLGLPHTDAASCMNTNGKSHVPTPEEIQTAKKPWNHHVAARQASSK